MMRSRMDDIVMPPEPFEVRETRRNVIGELAMATLVAAVAFLALGALFGLMALRAMQAAAVAAGVMWVALVIVLYMAVGIALCAAFARRLRFWGGAALSHIVDAKLAFVRAWPWVSGRILLKLIFHESTGGARYHVRY